MTATTDTDHDAFEAQVRRHTRELRVHCYRMTGSLEESEDLVQETFLRAWRGREQYAGRASLRAWLYKIATNACLDAIDKRPRTPTASGEILWLQPFPDTLLAELPSADDDPADAVVAKETFELTFLVAIQRLAPLPRAVLILRDVLDLSARETADVLETTVASVNSALQRARAGMREHLPARRAEWRPDQEPGAAQRDLLTRYLEASERGDVQALAAMSHEDLRFSMPPQPDVFEGRDAVIGCWVDGGFGSESFGSTRCVLTSANGQPTVAFYVRTPGSDAHRPLVLDTLRFEDGLLREVTAFDAKLFPYFGLPETV
jgi:RNA polymerase sigma-70 factor (TIGR02960 family)